MGRDRRGASIAGVRGRERAIAPAGFGRDVGHVASDRGGKGKPADPARRCVGFETIGPELKLWTTGRRSARPASLDAAQFAAATRWREAAFAANVIERSDPPRRTPIALQALMRQSRPRSWPRLEECRGSRQTDRAFACAPSRRTMSGPMTSLRTGRVTGGTSACSGQANGRRAERRGHRRDFQ
jgi:hypothetical protein